MIEEPVSEQVISSKRRFQRICYLLVRPLPNVMLALGVLVSVLPFLYMVMTSLKTYGSVLANNFWPWPPLGGEAIQWQNYLLAIDAIGWDRQWNILLFIRYFINSAIVSVAIVIGALATSLAAAYALTYVKLPGKSLILLLIAVTLMMPNDLTLVPKVVMIFNMHWYNTYFALTIPFMANALSILILYQFFLHIPKDLFDAARIDGSGHVHFLLSVVLPLSKPALLTVSLLEFIWSWDNFRWPFLVTRDGNMRVLSVGLQHFMMNEGDTNAHLLMAFATLMMLPSIIFYLFTARYFTEGMMTVGIKR